MARCTHPIGGRLKIGLLRVFVAIEQQIEAALSVFYQLFRRTINPFAQWVIWNQRIISHEFQAFAKWDLRDQSTKGNGQNIGFWTILRTLWIRQFILYNFILVVCDTISECKLIVLKFIGWLVIVWFFAQFDLAIFARHTPARTRNQFVVFISIRCLGAHPIDAGAKARLLSIHISAEI